MVILLALGLACAGIGAISILAREPGRPVPPGLFHEDSQTPEDSR
jgi:hypothetical protein